MNNRIINLAAFGILTLLWLGFIAALAINSNLLVTVWQTFRSWPIILQIVAGLLILPVTAGLWIWQTSWPVLLRVVLVLGLAWVTIYTFFPRKTTGQPQSSRVDLGSSAK